MTIEEIDNLILIAQTTHHFIFDTESDYRTNHPALIQIFFMLDTQQISPLLIVENEPSSMCACNDEPNDYWMTVYETNERHQQQHNNDLSSIEFYSSSSNDMSPTKLNTRRHQSLQARKRRNAKTSLHHRQNRYIYELIRSINTTIIMAQHILKLYNIKYRNINIVNSTLYIDLKSLKHQDECEELLSMDIFL